MQRNEVKDFDKNIDMDLADVDFITELNELRKSNIFCDAVITVPGETHVSFPIHRVVLASCSQYFRSLFKYGNNKSNEEITIYGVSPKTMSQIVEYGYLRKIEIAEDNFEDLFAAVDRFHVFGLLKDCSDFLLDQMGVENCIGILKFVQFYNCEALKSRALRFILSNFSEIVKESQEFPLMELSELKEILENDELSVRNEVKDFDKNIDMDLADVDFITELNELRKSNIFCDAVITVPGETHVSFPIHRVVLASCSQYFRSLFKSGNNKSNEEITIYGVSPKTMSQIVEYGYLRKIEIAEDNFEDLFAAADGFHVFGLLKDCSDFLLDQMGVENCIGILKFVQFYNCEALKSRALRFILSNFSEIVKESQEFPLMELSELKEILENDELSVRNESDVYVAIQRWIEFSYVHRRNNYESLFQTVRLGFCKRRFIENIIGKNKTIRKSKVSMKTIEKAKQIIEFRESTKTTCVSLSDPLLRPRVPASVIFTVGGWSSDGVVNTVETYDKNVDQWYSIVPAMSSKRSYHGTVALSDMIYVIGGYDSNRYLNSVLCFNPEKRCWTEKGPMHLARCYVSTCVVKNMIYACGGFDGRQRHNSVERYDEINNQWSIVQPMWQNRSDAGSACYDCKLYVAGGFDGLTCLDSMEMYCPKTDQWTVLQAMTVPRSGVALVLFNDCLVALGGYDGASRLPTTELFDFKRKTWRMYDEMNVGRSNFAAVVMEEQIYVIGGYDGSTTSNAVEVYNTEDKEWQKIKELNAGRSAVSACVVSNRGSLRDFTFYGAHSLNCKTDEKSV